MFNLLIYTFSISVSISPPIIFDLEKFTYPPPFFPFYYLSLDRIHILKLEYEKDPSDTIKFFEIYIRGYGELPEGISFSNFLFSTENLPLPQGDDVSGWKILSSDWIKIGKFPCKMKKGEINLPLIFILRVDGFYSIGKFNLTFQVRINAG